MTREIGRLVAGAALLATAGTASAQIGRDVGREVVAVNSTATTAAGGSALYIPPKPAASGVVGILMDYGQAGAFVCSGSLIGRRTVLTAAHCVSDGGKERPLSTTVYFYGGSDDPVLYFNPIADTRNVTAYHVNPGYTGQVVDQNDIAILRLGSAAPDYAPVYGLSTLTDLTGVDHVIAGYGQRSVCGGTGGTTAGCAAGTGRLRYAGNTFDFRLGDPMFGGFFDGWFGTADVDHVWITDFDNGTGLRNNSCRIVFELTGTTPAINCGLGLGDWEGIGAGGDSGGPYFVDGRVAAVHSFGWWPYGGDTTSNRFGILKGSVPVWLHRGFIAAHIPEPGTWAMMIAGFGLVGGAMRRRRAAIA